MKLERAGGLELKARQLQHVEIGHRLLEQIERRARPDCRPRARVRPAAAAMRATRLVTVLLPLVPVMPITGACTSRANSSISPSTSMPRSRAARRDRLLERHAGGHQHLRGAVEQRQIEAAETQIERLGESAQLREPRRRAARIGGARPAMPRFAR